MLPLSALSALLAVALSLQLANAHDAHGALPHHNKRQNTTSSSVVASSTTSSSAVTGSSTTSSSAANTPSGTASTASTPSSTTSTASTPSGTTSTASTPAGVPSGTASYGIPPLVSITSGLTEPTQTISSTYPAGAVPSYSGAPPLPSAFVFSAAQWPALDKIPPTDSPEVQQWMKELDDVKIPNITPTNGSECALSPVAAAQAEERVWWTCGGWTTPDDVTTCPDKLTWGLSFDDGPSPYTPKLLRYLKDHKLKATFFVVGSRVISYPEILRAEYMDQHDICVHTWSHHALTNMTNEQIVAELGWSKKAIQTVIGVTPTCFRAPFGDVDLRVRAIAEAMGLVNIIWTRTPLATFDTNDWHVPDGTLTAPQQFQIFENLLGNATNLETGFIVLAHDLYPETVDLAAGYTLDAALAHNPPFKLQSIGECQHWAVNDLYEETATKDIVPSSNSSGSNSSSSNSTGASESGGNGAAGLHLPSSALVGVLVGAVAAFFAGSL